MTQAASTAIRITIPPAAIMRWGSVMFLARRATMIPHTPIAVIAPRTARARTTRGGKFTAAPYVRQKGLDGGHAPAGIASRQERLEAYLTWASSPAAV